jgi:peptide chain release factor subunit 1
MTVAEADSRLRTLAETRMDEPLVLSLYLNLDPSDLPTPPARATAARSLIDAAQQAVRERDDELDHAGRQDLRASLQRAEAIIQSRLDSSPPAALALFVSAKAGLEETIGLRRPLPSRVAVDRSPVVGPLVTAARGERWCVALVNRRDARLFRGSPEALREVEQVHDDVPGRHDQGGWSQARYQRSVDEAVADHLKEVAGRLLEHWKREPFTRLLLGGPRETVSELEGKLHSYLTDVLAGHVEVDVDSATPQELLEHARDAFEPLEEQEERDALERVGARGAGGLAEVLPVLYERRVETLLLLEGFQAPGTLCPRCGWLGLPSDGSCPVDGTPTEQRDDVVEPAIELAIRQAAGVLPVRLLEDELRERGGIAALLRF